MPFCARVVAGGHGARRESRCRGALARRNDLHRPTPRRPHRPLRGGVHRRLPAIPRRGLPFHEWFIEFDTQPEDLDAFAQAIDEALQQQNSYYKDLIIGKILKRLEIKVIPQGGFNAYMKSKGKLGGQNKLPRLSNDRTIADALDKLDF